MSEVRKVTIETVPRGTVTTHQVTADVNVGGSLVDVSFDSEQDPELHEIVEQLQAKLRAMAVHAVQESLHSS
jgi:two-component sensor histidine kinase